MDAIKGELHPLQNSVVLDHLVSYILLEELPIFRRVCKSWFLSCLKKWRSNKTLHLQSFGAHSYAKVIESDALKQFYQFDKYPYFKLEVDRRIISSLSTVFMPTLRFKANFWNHFSHTLAHLTLKDIKLSEKVNYIWEVILFKLPNLTDLVFTRNFWNELDIERDNSYWTKKPIKNKLKRFSVIGNANYRPDKVTGEILQMCIPWFEFFRHFSELESLEITDVSNFRGLPYPKSFQYFNQLLNGIKQWEKKVENIPLKILKLQLARTPPIEGEHGRRRGWDNEEEAFIRFAFRHEDGIFPGEGAEEPDGVIPVKIQPLCDLKLPNLSALSIDLGFMLGRDAKSLLNERFSFIELGI